MTLLLALLGCGASPPPPPSPVTVVLTNQRAEPIYVQARSDCFQEPVAMRDAAGAAVQWSSQSLTCDDVRAGTCVMMGGCQSAGVLLLAPGASLTTAWDGAQVGWIELPAAEVREGCRSMCTERVGLAAGAYVLDARAWSRCEGDEAACGCVGACERPSGLVGEPDLVVEVPLVVPATGTVELVFGG